MNNSNSLDSPRKKRILSQQENEHVTPRHIKMSQISRHLSLEKRGDISDHRDNGLLGLASVAIVRYETREGHAKAQKDFAHTAGALVSCSGFFVSLVPAVGADRYKNYL